MKRKCFSSHGCIASALPTLQADLNSSKDFPAYQQGRALTVLHATVLSWVNFPQLKHLGSLLRKQKCQEEGAYNTNIEL